MAERERESYENRVDVASESVRRAESGWASGKCFLWSEEVL